MRNSSNSFISILLKLCRCNCHGLTIGMRFGYIFGNLNWCLSFAPCFSDYLAPKIDGQLTTSVESSFLINQDGYHDLFVCP